MGGSNANAVGGCAMLKKAGQKAGCGTAPSAGAGGGSMVGGRQRSGRSCQRHSGRKDGKQSEKAEAVACHFANI